MAGLSAQEELLMLRKRARRRLVGAIVIALVSVAVMFKVVKSVPDQAMRPESIEIAGEASAPVAAPRAASAPVAKAASASAPDAELPPPVAAAGTELPANLSSVAQDDRTAAKPAAEPAPPRPAQASAPSLKTPEPKTAPKPAAEPKPEAKPKPADPRPRKVDPAAILEGRVDGESGMHETPKPGKTDSKFEIQLAALSDSAKVDALRGKLSSVGVSARFSKVETSKGTVTRVRVGPFANRQEADAALRKLARAGVTGIIVSRP
ncbi:SPOR domain-containing protein [Paludibacterium paludis]|uniref:Sporulation protein n=1 Tax=Paludibacterium paludis TaxID=1225769 RepID=A0A918P6A8_9NEIS|nr:SPOR domain-containing protein [Paludibacterium paludis]GGY24995.1 sporulation protein [Paludibacterium paludis]